MADSLNDLFEDDKEDINIVPAPLPIDTPTQNHSSEKQNLENHYIFCSECGKKIKSNSKYCWQCGAKIDEEFSSPSGNTLTYQHEQKADTANEPILNHKISSDKPKDVKIKSDQSVKKSTIANEIVANRKMIGIALIIWMFYIFGFVIYRSKDAAPLTESYSYYGESCYDPVYKPDRWEFNWEKHLVSKIYHLPTKKNKYGVPEFDQLSTFDYLYLSNLTPERALEEAKYKAKVKNISDEDFAQLTQEAKEEAKRERNSFYEEVSGYRKYGFKNELYSHMIWAGVFSLAIMIFGRYFACRWVSRNKSD